MYHGAMHTRKGIEAARAVAPNATRVFDWAHVTRCYFPTPRWTSRPSSETFATSRPLLSCSVDLVFLRDHRKAVAGPIVPHHLDKHFRRAVLRATFSHTVDGGPLWVLTPSFTSFQDSLAAVVVQAEAGNPMDIWHIWRRPMVRSASTSKHTGCQ